MFVTLQKIKNHFRIRPFSIPESSSDDPHFIRAAHEWDLDRLYRDIKTYVMETITDRHKIILRGLL